MKAILTTMLGFFLTTQLLAQTPKPIPNLPEMIYVEGGTFRMGSNAGSESETPVHQVTVSSFSIGKYEVTVGQYKKFCAETGRSMPEAPSWGWQNRNPMEKVAYNDAVDYCNWLRKKYGGLWRLPTEAEWEYAARGGKKSNGYTYSGGNDLETVGWYKENSEQKIKPVGGKLPNELGIYDMSGNAFEWCSDWFSREYYANSPATNPQGPTSGKLRVMRSGGVFYESSFSRVAARIGISPDVKNVSGGFRVVLSQ